MNIECTAWEGGDLRLTETDTDTDCLWKSHPIDATQPAFHINAYDHNPLNLGGTCCCPEHVVDMLRTIAHLGSKDAIAPRIAHGIFYHCDAPPEVLIYPCFVCGDEIERRTPVLSFEARYRDLGMHFECTDAFKGTIEQTINAASHDPHHIPPEIL